MGGIQRWQADRAAQTRLAQQAYDAVWEDGNPFNDAQWDEILGVPSLEKANGPSGPSERAEVPAGMVSVPEGTVKDSLSPEARAKIASDYSAKTSAVLQKRAPFSTPDTAAKAFRNIFAPMSGYLGLEFGANIERAAKGGYVLDAITISDSFDLDTNMGWNAPIVRSETAVAWAHTHPDLNFGNKRFSYGDLLWSVNNQQDGYVFYPEGYGRKFDYSSYKAASVPGGKPWTVNQIYYYGQDIYAKPFK